MNAVRASCLIGQLLPASGCLTASGVVARLEPVAPIPPQTRQDSLIALAIASVLDDPSMQPEPHRVIVQLDSGLTSPPTLPDHRSIQYLLLSHAEIETMGRHSGIVFYLRVEKVRVNDDSALVFIGKEWLGRATQRDYEDFPTMTCRLVLRRGRYAWSTESQPVCLVMYIDIMILSGSVPDSTPPNGCLLLSGARMSTRGGQDTALVMVRSTEFHQ
jgi:hypothetical protein